MATVTITRDKEYKTAMRNSRFQWKWTYSWTADDDSHMVEGHDGRVVDIGGYGSNLGSLKDMLKRRYAKQGQQLKIVEAWK